MNYRAVLWDYAEDEPGGGGIDSTLSYEQLPKTEWFGSKEEAFAAGEELSKDCSYDYFVRIESKGS